MCIRDRGTGRHLCRDAQVRFIHDRKINLAGFDGDRPVIRGGCVEQVQDDFRTRKGGAGTPDSHLLEPVAGRAQAGGVDEAEEHAVDIQTLLDRICLLYTSGAFHRKMYSSA